MVRKKANGEGSIYYEKERQKYKACFLDPNGKRITKRFATKAEADEWIAKQKADIARSVYVGNYKVTVLEWVLEFLETYKAKNIRPKTMERYLQTAKYLVPIGNIQLQQLNGVMIQRFYNELPEDLSSSSKQKVHKLLSAALKKAYSLNMIPVNIIKSVEPPKVYKKEIEIFTQEELETIRKAFKKSQYYFKYYPIYLTAITTGARLGEILGLRWSCVHAGYIEIKNSLQMMATGGPYDERPKTQAGYRKITISKELQLELVKLGQAERILSLDQYVFHTRSGRPLSPRNWERIWKNFLQEAGVQHKRFHALRHTHATNLLAAGVPVMEVAKRLGHSKGAHTLNLYGHAIPGYDQQLAKKISHIFVV